MSQPISALHASSAVHVIGHDAAVTALRLAAATGTLPQALLLVGPPAIGKRTIARWVAQILCCQAAPASRPCGLCRACRLVAEGHHPDVNLDNERAPLRIEGGLALQRELSLAPAEAPNRIAVLGEIETASPSAANSLLKTLEEPPAHAVIILTATGEDDVLPTIRSRCRALHLRGTPQAVLAEALEGHGTPPETAQLLARLSGGRYGRALAMADDLEALAERGAWLDDLEHALSASRVERFGLASRLAQRGDALGEGLLTWCGWWRDLVLVQHGAEGGVTNVDRLPALHGLAARLSPDQSVRALRACQSTLRQIAARASRELALEVLLLALPDPERIAA